MTDLAVGMLLFGVLVLSGLSGLLVIMHIKAQRILLDTLQELSENQTDSFAKLLQTAMIHHKAATVGEAVSMQSVLEREQAVLEQTAETLQRELQTSVSPIKRPIGFKDATGRVHKFLAPPPPHLLEGIDKSRLVYS